MKKAILFAFIMGFLSAAASAQVATPVKKQRVAQGVKNGELTRMEAARLHHMHARKNRARQRALKDGHLSVFEKRKLAGMNRHENRQIYIKKHNHRKRFA